MLKILISKQIFFKYAILSLGTFTIFYLLYLANENLKTRYFYLAFFSLIILHTIYLSKRKRKDLLAITEGSERSLAISRMKFRAEVAAAFSLLAFFGPYYITGFELDKISTHEQQTHWTDANDLIKKSMTDEYCSTSPYRVTECKSVEKKMASLFHAIIDGIGDKAYKEIDSIIDDLNYVDLPKGSVERNILNKAMAKLSALDLRDWWMTRIFATIPLFASFFASMAVSSKVAVAWTEWSVRETELQTKEQKIKAQKESEHKRLKEEAAHKEQLNF